MANNLWRTPDPVFNFMDERYNFEADMAASLINKKVNRYFTEEDNSLGFTWSKMLPECSWVWCNPPYDQPYPWVWRAVESQRYNLGSLLLVKTDHSTAWFDLAFENCSKIIHVRGGRISFIPPKPEDESSNNFCSMFLEFDPLNIGKQQTEYVHIKDLMNASN